MDNATRELIEATAEATVAEFTKAYHCRFTQDEARNVHALGEAMKEEGGNTLTLRVVVQLGNNYRDITAGLRKWGVIMLFTIIAIVGALFGAHKLGGIFAK